MRLLIFFVFVFGVMSLHAQEFLANDSNGRLVKLNLDGCVTQSLGNIGSFTDIASHPDGFIYAIKSSGEIHRVDLQGATVQVVAELDGSAYYGLTASSDGLLFAGTGGGTLKSYNPYIDEIKDYPNMGFGVSGDLTFYKGQLYIASSTNELVRIQPENPELNKVLIDFSEKNAEIFGIVSTLYECEIRTFAISSDFNARVFEIGWEDGTFNEFCTVNARIYGGSSEFEFKGSRDVLYIESFKKRNELCEIADYSVTLNGEGIGDTIYYSLDNINFQLDPTFEGLGLGQHFIYLQNELGCVGKDSIFLEQGNLNISIDENIPASCGESNGGFSFIIDTNADNFFLNDLGEVTIVDGLSPGEYSFLVSDTDGCVDSIRSSVDSLPPLAITDITIKPTTCGDDNGEIEIEVNQDDIVVAINESIVNGKFIDNLAARDYKLLLRDSLGCKIDTSILVTASPDCDIYIPNIFSPNDDGFNDVFELFSPEIYEVLNSRIYDRWGSEVYKGQNVPLSWDGKFNGMALSAGHYTYYIQVQGKSRVLEFVGDVNLVR